MAPAPYTQLVAKLKRIHTLDTVTGLLGWDEQVNLPPDSANQRAEQLALLAELQHQAAGDPEIGALLTELEGGAHAGLDADQRIVVHHARRDYDRVTRLPADFVAEQAAHASRAYHAWAAARKKSDFAAFAPFIEKHLALARREAAYLGWGDRPYDYMIDRHDPGMDAATIRPLFTELKAGLVPLLRDIIASPVNLGSNSCLHPTSLMPEFSPPFRTVKTFRECYCEKYRCKVENFERKVFWRCLYWHAWLLAPLLMFFTEDYFNADRELVLDVGACTNRQQVKEVIDRYFTHPANARWVRLGGRVRLSSHAVRRLARELLDEPGKTAEPRGS